LKEQGLYDDTAILVSGDHGENLGELNIYGDHQTADEHTCHVPAILKWPGITDARAGQVDNALHYQFDLAATSIELLGAEVPDNWQGVSRAEALRAGEQIGHEGLILSQAAWTCQRSFRFRDKGRELICIRSYHDGHHGFPETMLFDLAADPHEQNNLAAGDASAVQFAITGIDHWLGQRMRDAQEARDPMWTVIGEGGPKHTRGELAAYLDRLRSTGRGHWADLLESRHS
jgi:arylsulfatase A-like enzyme